MAVWSEMLPIGAGVGAGMMVISLIVAIYYNVIMAYCLVYLFNSFREVLPWTVCSEHWGADHRFTCEVLWYSLIFIYKFLF